MPNSNRGMDDQKGRKGGERSGNQEQKGKRGLAAADEETRQRVASEGGKAAHQKGTAHEFNSEEAREAARARARGESSSGERE